MPAWLKARLSYAVFLLVLFLCSGAFGADDAPKGCSLKLVLSLDLAPDRGTLLVDAKINGRDVRLALDTGGYSSLKKSLVDDLKLKMFGSSEFYFTDADGGKIKQATKIESLEVGGFRFVDRPFLVAYDPGLSGGQIDGLLGSDFLSSFDVEVDFAHRKVNLFSKDHCRDPGAYWTQDFATIPLTIIYQHIYFPTVIAGKKFTTMLDTGATDSTLSGEVDCSQPDSNSHYPLLKRFDDVDIGGISIRNTDIKVLSHRCLTQYWPSQAWYRQNTGLFVMGIRSLGNLRFYINYADKLLYASGSGAK